MNCCQCRGIETTFNQQAVARELEDYRKHGPSQTTRWLIQAVTPLGISGASLLDIGGGVGAVQHGLLAAGARQALDVDASCAYLAAAESEAERRGLGDRSRFRHGNFIDLAPEIPAADIVTLDRVLCCYPEMRQLVRLSVERARRIYAVVYPRDGWWVRLGVAILNGFFRLQRNPFRTFAHPSAVVDELVRSHGFTRRFHRQTLVWQVVVYERA